MAKDRVVPNDLPNDSLQVTARPVDTFHGAHLQNPTDGFERQSAELTNGLANFSHQVSRYALRKVDEGAEADTKTKLAELQAASTQHQGDVASLVRTGDMDFGSNPWANRAAKQMLMRQTARKFGQEIATEYATSPAGNLSPDAFQGWVREQFDKKAKAVGFEKGDMDPDFIDSFAPTRDHVVEQLTSQHMQVVAQRNVQDFQIAFKQEVADSADMATPENDQGHANHIGQLAEAAAISNGMRPQDAYEMTVHSLVERAINTGETRYIDIAEKVPTKDGTGTNVPMGSRLWAQDLLAKARQATAERAHSLAAAEHAHMKVVKDRNSDSFLAQGVQIILSGGSDMYQKADLLKKQSMGVIAAGQMDPDVHSKFDTMMKTAVSTQQEMQDKGIKVGDGRYDQAKANVMAWEVALGQHQDPMELQAAISGDPALMAHQDIIIKAMSQRIGDRRNTVESGVRSTLDMINKNLSASFPADQNAVANIGLSVKAAMDSAIAANTNLPPSTADGKGYQDIAIARLKQMSKDLYGVDIAVDGPAERQARLEVKEQAAQLAADKSYKDNIVGIGEAKKAIGAIPDKTPERLHIPSVGGMQLLTGADVASTEAEWKDFNVNKDKTVAGVSHLYDLAKASGSPVAVRRAAALATATNVWYDRLANGENPAEEHKAPTGVFDTIAEGWKYAKGPGFGYADSGSDSLDIQALTSLMKSGAISRPHFDQIENEGDRTGRFVILKPKLYIETLTHAVDEALKQPPIPSQK